MMSSEPAICRVLVLCLYIVRLYLSELPHCFVRVAAGSLAPHTLHTCSLRFVRRASIGPVAVHKENAAWIFPHPNVKKPLKSNALIDDLFVYSSLAFLFHSYKECPKYLALCLLSPACLITFHYSMYCTHIDSILFIKTISHEFTKSGCSAYINFILYTGKSH